jgi:O-antigen/teichoic acid export membrane protein
VSGSGPGLSTKVARGVAWAAGAQAVIAVADLVSQLLVVALWIPKQDLGIAGGAMAFYTALDYMADLGVTSALIQRDDHTPERVSTVFWFNLLVSGALFVLLLGLGPLYGMLQGDPRVGWLLIAYGGKLVLQNVYSIPFALLRKELRFSEIAKARVVAHLCESGARIAFAASGVTVWCWTLAALTRALVFGVIMQAWHPFLPKLVFRPREVTEYVRFGIRTAASQVLYQLYTSMDVPVILYYFGPAAAGIYTLADQIVLEPVKTIANVVIDVAFPTFARLRADARGLVDQFIKFTRLNLIAVLPFAALILLVIPDFLHAFYKSWSPADLDLAATAARILCVMGFFRALGFLGPPLLDGVGRPELTLRYMVVATICVPGSFWLGAVLLGNRLGFLSVAVAWAIGYPLAFAALAYLVVRTIELPVREYIAGCWGIIGSCGIGIGVAFGVAALLPPLGHVPHMVIVGGTFLLVTGALLATWQKITPSSIARSLKGTV